MTYQERESCGCSGDVVTDNRQHNGLETDVRWKPEVERSLMGRELSLLVAAGAAIGANSEACLKVVVEDLGRAKVSPDLIRGAVSIGQVVKDKPARRLREAADALTGSQLSAEIDAGPCPMTEAPKDETFKQTMLIAAGSAMAAGCEPCLNQAIPGLIEAGVADADIRRALEIGQAVKDDAAANLKEVADVLAGTSLSVAPAVESLADSELREPAGCCG